MFDKTPKIKLSEVRFLAGHYSEQLESTYVDLEQIYIADDEVYVDFAEKFLSLDRHTSEDGLESSSDYLFRRHHENKNEIEIILHAKYRRGVVELNKEINLIVADSDEELAALKEKAFRWVRAPSSWESELLGGLEKYEAFVKKYGRPHPDTGLFDPFQRTQNFEMYLIEEKGFSKAEVKAIFDEVYKDSL